VAASSAYRTQNDVEPISLTLERRLDSHLKLPWVADANAKKPGEVEQRRRRQRVDVVDVVEGVEHLQAGNNLAPCAKAEASLEPPVERKVRVVLPIPVAAAIDAVQDARRGRDWLRGSPLNPRVEEDVLRELDVREDIHLVADVAV